MPNKYQINPHCFHCGGTGKYIATIWYNDADYEYREIECLCVRHYPKPDFGKKALKAAVAAVLKFDYYRQR